MQIALRKQLPRAVLVLVVAAAAFVARMEGGGADRPLALPRPDPTPAATGSLGRARGTEAWEVRTRLVELLGEASIEVPSLAAARPYFQSYWRKVRGPWAHPPGVAGQLVTTISLRTSRSEKQWSVHTQAGSSWTPEARVWNMNEGSYEQREAIFAPTPSTIAFRMTLPPAANLRLAPAVAMPLPATTVFDVAVIDAQGLEHHVFETRIPGAEARSWRDVSVDLTPWSGQTVSVRLDTRADRPAPDEKHWIPSSADSDTEMADGGVADAPGVPPMSLALWGDPVLVTKEPTRLPYNVLWIVVDALRPDVIAALHDAPDDAAKLAAPRPPLDALLPKLPGLMPGIEALAGRGVHFAHAWSAGSWTRPGTLAMLAGERSSELGIDPTVWLLSPEQVARYYASDPPMLPLLLRKSGATTAAFVNNFFIGGYAAVGLDTGFERVTDHRYRTRDTAEITHDATAWLEAHALDRFFLFVNYNSPHQPYDPPPEILARIPPPPAGPRDPEVRQYVAEAIKDDAAIAELLGKVDAIRLADLTLIIVTSDHGETLSAAHTGFGPEHIPIRFHHAVGNFEETTRVPIVMALPGVLDGGRQVLDRVRTIDIAPTILEVEGLEADPRMTGRSMLSLARGNREPQPRVVVNEGRGSRAILWGRWRLIVHEPMPNLRTTLSADAGADGGLAKAEDELYDLQLDPGERRNVARLHPDVMADMRARLEAAAVGTGAADTSAVATGAGVPATHMRFAGAGRVHQVSGVLSVGDRKHSATLRADAEGIPSDAIRVTGPHAEFWLRTSADRPVGFDLRVDPPGAPLSWQLFLDDAPWPEGATFAGPYGLPAVAARTGVANDDGRAEVYSPELPYIDPARDLGVFVTRDRPGDTRASPGEAPREDEDSAAAKREMERMLEVWGYAHGPAAPR